MDVNGFLKYTELGASFMPYINEDRRQELNSLVNRMHVSDIRNAGELNYLITNLVIAYLGEDYNYQKLNDVMGALTGANMELYRRVVADYENAKRDENGDVYDLLNS